MHDISLKAEELFHLGSFPITNALITSYLAFGILIIIAFVLNRNLATVPGTIQTMGEFIIEGMLGLMDSVLGNRKASEKYLPLVATIFLFVLLSNWLGLMPGVGSIVYNVADHGEHHAVPLLRAPSSDLNFTLAIAIAAVLAVNLIGVTVLGFRGHMRKFFDFSNPIAFFVGILELVSEFAKIISFSFRLFGNVFAGEVLLVIIAFLVPYIAPLPFLFLEIFVGFIQAFVFAMLTLVFLGTALTAHGEEH